MNVDINGGHDCRANAAPKTGGVDDTDVGFLQATLQVLRVVLIRPCERWAVQVCDCAQREREREGKREEHHVGDSTFTSRCSVAKAIGIPRVTGRSYMCLPLHHDLCVYEKIVLPTGPHNVLVPCHLRCDDHPYDVTNANVTDSKNGSRRWRPNIWHCPTKWKWSRVGLTKFQRGERQGITVHPQRADCQAHQRDSCGKDSTPRTHRSAS